MGRIPPLRPREVISDDDRRITDRLDDVYATQPSRLDPLLAAAQTRALRQNDWSLTK